MVSRMKVLGELESQIMEIVWARGNAVSVKAVAEVLSKKRPIAYTTVMTVMARLSAKDILERRIAGNSYLYKPKVSKEKFIAKAVHGIFSQTLTSLGEGVLAHFIKEIEKISPAKRRELIKILNDKN